VKRGRGASGFDTGGWATGLQTSRRTRRLLLP